MNICSLYLQEKRMPRPKTRRKVNRLPIMEGFKPFGIPSRELEFENLSFDEYESIKLTDYDGLTHEESSEHMGISRPTFTRIYEMARKKIAKVLVEGKGILISGGDVDFAEKLKRCQNCKGLYHDHKEKEHEKDCEN
jgi:predicted DNA-binding protein (UPF0251 family)